MARTRLGSRGSFSGQVIEKITAAETITNGDSGKVFLLDSASGAYSITMPTTLKAGVNYKFIVQEDTPAGAITLAFGSAIVDGQVLAGDASTAKCEGTDGTAISNAIIGIGAKQGAWLEFVCDGTSWYFSGGGFPDGWVTFS